MGEGNDSISWKKTDGESTPTGEATVGIGDSNAEPISGPLDRLLLALSPRRRIEGVLFKSSCSIPALRLFCAEDAP